MKRRTFIIRAASVAGAVVATNVLAFGQSHGGHGKMSGMNHGNMGNMNHGSMMGESGHDMAQMISPGYQLGNRTLTVQDIQQLQNATKDLLPASAIPQGTDLPALPMLKNESTEPKLFKATLTAKPVNVELIKGKPTDFWAYNDSIPGPTIEVYEGDTVEITLDNQLPQPTTIHWHGILVPADQDGNPQDEVQSGTKRTYKFTIPEGTAGTYWYHPHGHNTVAEQAYRGLAGVFIVKSKTDPYAKFTQQNWLFSDLKLKANGKIAENTFNDWMNGREGQFLLMNGALKPTVNITEPTRVRIWNACSAKFLNLSLADAKVYIIATDGGFLENPQEIQKLLLTPGERAELLIVPTKTGTVALKSLAYDRGKMGMVPADPDMDIATVNLQKSASVTLPKNIRQLPVYEKPSIKRLIEYTEVMNHNQMLFLVNGKMHDMNHNDVTVKAGEVEEWIIFNNSHMDHNFHIHGTQFLVIEHDYNEQKSKPEINGFKDTVNLRPYEKVTIRFVQDEKGLRMYHCHIFEHETLGMMGQLMTK